MFVGNVSVGVVSNPRVDTLPANWLPSPLTDYPHR